MMVGFSARAYGTSLHSRWRGTGICGVELLHRSSFLLCWWWPGRSAGWLTISISFMIGWTLFAVPTRRQLLKRRLQRRGWSTITDGIVLFGLLCTSVARRRWTPLSGRR